MAARFGLYPGTFDPPHLAHLDLATMARDRLDLTGVVLLPAGDPPNKPSRHLAPARDRI